MKVTKPQRPCVDAGFTLVEMSIVMAIMGLVLAGAATLLSGHVGAERQRLTETRLSNAADALAAYFVVNNRLPCPADGSLASVDANYGRSQPETGGVCDTAAVTPGEAVLPWRTLGLREPDSLDGWQQRIRYLVTSALTTSGSNSPGSLVIRDGDALNPGSVELASDAAFVLISQGENGLGALLSSGAAKDATGASTDEQLNIDGNGPFVDRRYSSIAGDEFDDLIAWQTKLTLNRAAGVSFTNAVCTAADSVWAGACAAPVDADACTLSEAVRSRCP